jgi:hypothetical protein
MWLGVPITLCFHSAEIPYLVTDTCSGVCDWTWDSSYIATIDLMLFLQKNSRTKACDWGCQPLCIFHYAEMPYLVTDTCYVDCDWTWDSSYIANKY